METKKLMMAFLALCSLLGSCAETDDRSANGAGSDSIETLNSGVADSSFGALAITLKSDQKFNYYLYAPNNPTENLPLILYLHGGSGKPKSEEGDLSLLTKGDGLPKFAQEDKISANSYIVFPQLPYGKRGWSDVKSDLLLFLDEVSSGLKCNKERISITGHSMGGKGTWDIALSCPNAFYKVAPLSGNVTLDDANLAKLENKPVWAFVGTEDTIVDPQSSIDFINALSKTNPEAKITIIEGYTHFDVPNVYLSSEYNLLSWLVD